MTVHMRSIVLAKTCFGRTGNGCVNGMPMPNAPYYLCRYCGDVTNEKTWYCGNCGQSLKDTKIRAIARRASPQPHYEVHYLDRVEFWNLALTKKIHPDANVEEVSV